MARYRGVVGYGKDEESATGVFKTVIHEHTVFGDIEQDTRRLTPGEGVNQNLTLGDVISIIAPAEVIANYSAIRYITMGGVRWSVTSVVVRRPRLVVRTGEVYNGPTV